MRNFFLLFFIPFQLMACECDCKKITREFLLDRMDDLEEWYDPYSEEKSNYWIRGMLDAYADCWIYLFPDHPKQ